MPDIEFLVPGADRDPADEELGTPTLRRLARERAGPPRRQLSTTLAAGLWAIAAALCLLAPFQAVYTQVLPGGGDRVVIDGWGRIGAAPDVELGVAGHAPRYGVPLAWAGAVCLVLALIVAVTAWRGRSWGPATERLLPAVGLLAAGVIIGVGVAAWLFVAAARDQIAAAMVGSTASEPPVDASAFPRLADGPFLVLAVVAGIGAAAGSLATWLPVPKAAASPDDAATSAPTAPDSRAELEVAQPVAIAVVSAPHPAPTPTDGEELLGG
jgi:hypothetical protein